MLASAALTLKYDLILPLCTCNGRSGRFRDALPTRAAHPVAPDRAESKRAALEAGSSTRREQRVAATRGYNTFDRLTSRAITLKSDFPISVFRLRPPSFIGGSGATLKIDRPPAYSPGSSITTRGRLIRSRLSGKASPTGVSSLSREIATVDELVLLCVARENDLRATKYRTKWIQN